MNLTVREFLEACRQRFDLDVFQGEAHLDREVREPALNRPGLALAGFLRYFAHRRIQVIGLAELTYLKSLGLDERAGRLKAFFECGIPCVVLARGIRPLPEMPALAEANGVPILRTRWITGRFVQSATVLIEGLIAPRIRYQGTMVDIMGIGVIIEGQPGVGKSETALNMITRGYSLVADDLVELRRTSTGEIIGSAAEITRFHMEIRGLGIIHVPSLFGILSVRREKRLDMIVRLERTMDSSEEERTGLAQRAKVVLESPVPFFRIPVVAGRDVGDIVETAALNFRLRQLGRDAAKELDERLMKQLLLERPRASD